MLYDTAYNFNCVGCGNDIINDFIPTIGYFCSEQCSDEYKDYCNRFGIDDDVIDDYGYIIMGNIDLVKSEFKGERSNFSLDWNQSGLSGDVSIDDIYNANRAIFDKFIPDDLKFRKLHTRSLELQIWWRMFRNDYLSICRENKRKADRTKILRSIISKLEKHEIDELLNNIYPHRVYEFNDLHAEISREKSQ